MKTRMIAAAVGSLACYAQGTDGMDFFKDRRLFESFSVTSTNISVRFTPPTLVSWRVITRSHGSYESRRTKDYLEKNEDWILTPDQETVLGGGGHITYYFTPVSFKDQRKGFRIMDVTYALRSYGRETNSVAYVALSDTPVAVGEDDVEMILVTKLNSSGYADEVAWKKYEETDKVVLFQPTKPSPPNPEPVQPAAVETPPEPPAVPPPEPVEAQAPVLEDGTPDIADGEDGQSEEKSETGNLWLYALIPLFAFFVILYFIRRRPKI